MARYIRVSSLSVRGGVNYAGDLNKDLKLETDRMIDSWNRLLQNVLPNEPNLIVLPEICDQYYNYPVPRRHEYYEVRGNRVRDFFMEKAYKNSCHIAYSAVRKMDDGTFRNSTQIINPRGEIVGIYNKNHPTIGETEEDNILPGKDAKVISCDFGKVACAICFDLNFDPLWEKYKPQSPDIILFSSAYHGGLMQNYRAYRLRSYFIGSIIDLENTVINPVGQTIAKSTNYFGYVTHDINLDYKVVHLAYNQEKIKKAISKYGSKIKMLDPGYLGAVLLTSETDEFTIEDIIEEYKIELLDEYFDRALAFQAAHVEK
ncbi:MAG: carbon-nitrogen hydrolase family protein [Clostridia bacterium]|jgi:apolipoprotein N-acyltransferase|nr:carbon-nitrogen hydrolase family protein [Clostridiaceae bacterium]